MRKAWIAILLGVLSFLVFMFVGEGAGFVPAFIAVAAFLFVCQFLLSRGHVDAHRKDWRIMLTLAAPLLVTTFLMVLLEKREIVLAQAPVMLAACVGIYAGAVVASLAARRTAVRSSSRRSV
ncbi:hypothetical protein IMZ48_44025 [Candidatus Bathyarchaeota archaeon]|nr:hypothetical protein [Candidatus Bathyarchaeota archaeon]MBE3135387.1 hypothetical protein [Acidobacteriota bacterium]